MSAASDDPHAPNRKFEPNSAQQETTEKAATPGPVGRPGQAALLAAALATASATSAGAALPSTEPDRAHLEALLHGSWTQPPDLTMRRLADGSKAEPAQLTDDLGAGAFNDTWNPDPKPYHDKLYADSGFGDRTDK